MRKVLHKPGFTVLTLVFAILLWSGPALGQTNIWTGAINNSWSNVGNWSLGIIPTNAHDVVINTSADIIFSFNVPVGSLTITNNATVNFTLSSAAARTLTLNKTGLALDIQAGSTLGLIGVAGGGNSRMIVAYAAGAGKTGTIAGNLVLNTPVGGNNDEGVFNPTNSVTTVTGKITNAGGLLTGAAVGNLIFSGTGVYEHAFDGGNVPGATWNAGSTLLVSGAVTNIPGNLNHTISNFTWNSVGQTGALQLPNGIAINNNFTVTSTGTGELALGSSVFNVGGDLTINGGTLRISGNNSRNMIVTGNVVIAGGVLLMTTGNGTGTLSVAGNYTHSGGLVNETGGGANSRGDIVFNGTGGTIQTFTTGGTGTVTNTINYIVNTGSILYMAANATAVIGNNFTLNTGATLGIRSPDGITATGGGAVGNIQVAGTRAFNAGATYIYLGPGAQNIGTGLPDLLTGNLTIDNPANTVTLNVGRTIQNLGTINLLNGILAAGTNLGINSTATIQRSEGSMTATSFTGTGVYNINYTGNSKTTTGEFIGGLTIPSRINNITVNLSPGGVLTVDGNGTVVGPFKGYAMGGDLALSNGLVNTGLTSGLLLTDLATCNGGGSAASHVNGPLAKTGTAAFRFPIGTNGFYMPIAISGSNVIGGAALPSSHTLIAQVFQVNPLVAIGNAITAPLISISDCIYWDLNKLVGTGDVFVFLNSDALSSCIPLTPDPTQLRVAHWEGAPSSWTSYGGQEVQDGAGIFYIGSTIPISVFSPFTIGAITAALPVELTEFSASVSGASVLLKWKTASEQNNAYFDIERSSDGVSFSSIGKVNGNGNSTLEISYGFTDQNPLTGNGYYRLKQVDFDGKFAYSKIVTVNITSASASLKVYPNPASKRITIENIAYANKKVGVQLIDNQGRILINSTQQVNGSGRFDLDFGNRVPASGPYWLRLNSNDNIQNARIIIER